MRKTLQPSQSEMEIIQDIYNKIGKYRYGVPVGGRLETNIKKLTIPFMLKHYKFLSPDQLDRYKGGICYDTANAFFRHLEKNHIKCKIYWAQCYWPTEQGPLVIFHSFTVAKLKGGKYAYIEASAGNNNGIHMFRSMMSVWSKVMTGMTQAASEFKKDDKKRQFDVIDITNCIPSYGTNYQNWVNNAYENGKMIKRGVDKEFVKQELTQEATMFPIESLQYFQEATTKEMKKTLQNFEKELKNNPTYDSENKTIEVTQTVTNDHFDKKRNRPFYQGDTKTIRVPIHYLIESKNKKQNRNLLKFLADHDFDPKNGTIETGLFTDSGEKHVIKFGIDGIVTDGDNEINLPIPEPHHDPANNAINMSKFIMKQTKPIANTIFDHEVGHTKDHLANHSDIMTHYHSDIQQEKKMIREWIKDNHIDSSSIHDIIDEELYADLYSAKINGFNNAKRTLTFDLNVYNHLSNIYRGIKRDVISQLKNAQDIRYLILNHKIDIGYFKMHLENTNKELIDILKKRNLIISYKNQLNSINNNEIDTQAIEKAIKTEVDKIKQLMLNNQKLNEVLSKYDELSKLENNMDANDLNQLKNQLIKYYQIMSVDDTVTELNVRLKFLEYAKSQGLIQEYSIFDIHENIYQESKLSIKERDELNDSDFGIPEKRAFPIHDEAHVKAAVKMFSHADAKDKKQLAKRILSKAKKFGMDTSGWDSINEYVQESYVEESFNDFINGVNSKSKKLFFHCTEHGSTNPEDFFKTFEPRIPQWLLKATSTEQKRLRYEETRKKDGSFENYDTPRICISPSIEGALNSLSCYVKDFKTMKGKILYVYTTLKPINQYHIKSNKDIIKDKDVYDARVTGETWLLEKTTLRLYGVIKIDSIREAILPGLSADIKNGGTTQRYAIKWHWEISPKEIESDPKMKSIIEKGRDRQLQNNDYIPSIKRKKVVNEFYEPLSEFDHYFKHVKE